MIHRRILGSLFWAWAVLQIVSAVVVARTAQLERPVPAFFWVLMAVLVVAYAAGGWVLWFSKIPGRPLLAALSVMALLSFPLGTALGVYGLWVTFGKPTRQMPGGQPKRPYLEERHA